MLWAARGTYARAAGVKPYERNGWRVPLRGPVMLQKPLLLDVLRERRALLEAIRDELRTAHPKQPLYFPIELGKRPPRFMQWYLAKLPRAFVLGMPELAEASMLLPTTDADELTARVGALLRTGPIARPAGRAAPKKTATSTTAFARDPQVSAFVLQEAGGHCEACGAIAPFETDDGRPFLEVHHLKRLADGGSDTVENAVAVCPNCHRRLHYASDRVAYRLRVLARIARLKAE